MKPIKKTKRPKVPWYGILILAALFLCNCAKEKAVIIPVNDGPLSIELCNKPIDTIMKYIQGNWKYVYGIGGWGPLIHKCDSCYIEITPDNRFINKTGLKADTLFIEWEKQLCPCSPVNDSSYVMYCYHRGSQSTSIRYLIDRIDHDTLEFHDNFEDGIMYRYIKNSKK